MMGKIFILSMILLATGQHQLPTYRYVYVKNCGGEFVPVYADRRLTVPMPNPFIIVDSYTFYTPSKCVSVEAK